jgi:Putative abortive phage resistance protein AbiGi, antitoxin
MIKTVEYISHFCEKEPIKKILSDGFKPSYANEKFQDFNALIPMVSFSNILLRDVGKDEVLSYGDYAIFFTREWGVLQGLNPELILMEMVF